MRHKFALIIFNADDTLRRCIIPAQLIPTSPGEWELLPGIKETLAEIKWGSPRHGGTAIGVASNQSWIAKGRVSQGVAKLLLVDMIQSAIGFSPPGWTVELCPHLAEDNCKCRKPKPTMLKSLMGKWGVEPGATLFVGDAGTDREAAARAGCWFAWPYDFFGKDNG